MVVNTVTAAASRALCHAGNRGRAGGNAVRARGTGSLARAYASAIVIVALLVVGAPGASASKTQLDPDLAKWQVFTPPGKRAASFRQGDAGMIEIEAQSAISFLYQALPERSRRIDQLRWRWRVDQLPPATDLSRSGMDDRPLAVHVWFGKLQRETSFWDNIKGFVGYPVFQNVITYVWGGVQARGAVIENPHLPESVLIVLRGSETAAGSWFDEAVDPLEDYRRVFGRSPATLPMYIAISVDTDDSGGTALGQIGALELVAEDAGGEG